MLARDSPPKGNGKDRHQVIKLRHCLNVRSFVPSRLRLPLATFIGGLHLNCPRSPRNRGIIINGHMSMPWSVRSEMMGQCDAAVHSEIPTCGEANHRNTRRFDTNLCKPTPFFAFNLRRLTTNSIGFYAANNVVKIHNTDKGIEESTCLPTCTSKST